MITYKLCQVIVQDAHREARKNHLVKEANGSRKIQVWYRLTRLANRYGLIHAH